MDSPNRNKNDTTPSVISVRTQAEHMLQNAVLMTEMGMDLKERCVSGEKYVCYLRSLAVRASRTMVALKSSAKSFLLMAQKLVIAIMNVIDNMPIADQVCYNIKFEYEKLLLIIEKELADIDDVESSDCQTSSPNLNNIAERIKYLENKQKMCDNSLMPSSSARSVKSDVDEKYPENWSKESLIDLSNVINLPPVPEDIFTGYPNKPVRTSSLSSLKSMRKVKLFLQRASSNSDEEDESSEFDEHDFSKLVAGDIEKKPYLGNIKEETQD